MINSIDRNYYRIEEKNEALNYGDMATGTFYKKSFSKDPVDIFLDYRLRQLKPILRWGRISYIKGLPVQFIEEFKDELDWKIMSTVQNFSAEDMVKFISHLDIETIAWSESMKLNYEQIKVLRPYLIRMDRSAPIFRINAHLLSADEWLDMLENDVELYTKFNQDSTVINDFPVEFNYIPNQIKYKVLNTCTRFAAKIMVDRDTFDLMEIMSESIDIDGLIETARNNQIENAKKQEKLMAAEIKKNEPTAEELMFEITNTKDQLRFLEDKLNKLEKLIKNLK